MALGKLREVLLARADEVHELLDQGPRIHHVLDRNLDERRLAENHSVAATLAKLFVLSTAVPLADAEPALTPVKLAELVELGLAEIDGAVIRPICRVAEYEGVLVCCDVMRGEQPAHVVTGLSPSARRFDRLTIRRPVARTLDLGTGPGIQALLAARHSERVAAVDLNERALAFAEFNARLNATSNVELRSGNWFEPVAGERFDLIVANPPYVVSPDNDLLYRDGDLPGDAVTRKLVREVPGYLEEGGFAQIMGNWAHGADEDWRAPLEACLAGSGCDALLLRYPSIDLVSYAALWNLTLSADGQAPFFGSVDRWLGHYKREGVEAISDGMIVLRRRSGGPNWVRAIEVPGKPTASAGDHILRLFVARDRRNELAADEAVLAARFTLAPGLKVTSRSEGAHLEERTTKVGLEHGIGFAVAVPGKLAELLPSLDGSTRVGELVGGEAEVVAAARRLFALGLLELLT